MAVPDLVPAPSYPNYFAGLSNLIGGLPADYRAAQLQQGAVDTQNAFKGGVPTNPDGTPNYAEALQILAKSNPDAVTQLGPLAQGQSFLQQAQTPSPLLGGAAGAPVQLPSAAPVAPQPAPAPQPPPPITASVSDGGATPTLAALVSGVVPDPAKSAMTTGLIAKALKVDPAAPLTPDQVARAQRILAANGYGQASDAPAKLPPSRGTTSQAAAYAETAAGERANGYDPNRKLTQAEAVAIATGKPRPPADQVASLEKNIAGKESGGNYAALGPITKSGDRAYGKYQVMGANVGPWTKEALGRAMTPEEFLKDGEAQEKVADYQMRKLVKQGYTLKDVASIWFTGKPLAEGAGRRDQLGTSGAQYAEEATRGIGGAQGGQPANRPIFPQVPLPPGITDPQQAILAIDREMARLSPNPAAKGQVDALADWRDRIAASTAPLTVAPTATIVDPRTGKPVYQGPFASGAGMLNPLALDAAAENYYQTGKLPPGVGRGIQGSGTLNSIISRASELHPDADWSERPQAWQSFNAGAAGQSLLAKRTASLELAENEASSLIPRVREASKNVSRSQYPALNTIIEAGLTGTGDPNIVKFGIAVESLAQTYARVLSPTGSPTAADKANAHDILSKYWGQGQIDAALDQMELEIASAKQSLERTRGEMSGGERGADRSGASPTQSTPGAAGQPVKVTTKADYDALPSGTPYTAPDGSVRTKQ